jgi:hypothetical protein
MINYTERISLLMEDIVARVPMLSFIDMSRVLVFARAGRSDAEGAYATCHCVSLPPSEPGYYFWRDRGTGKLTRRSEWFVTKSPTVKIGTSQIDYMISFTLPRFCDQMLSRSRKQVHYAGAPNWIAKLDTIIHELYHIDPKRPGIRRMERADGTESANCHGHRFFEDVVEMVNQYVDSKPDPEVVEFLEWDLDQLSTRFGGVIGTTVPRLSPPIHSAIPKCSIRSRPVPKASTAKWSRSSCRAPARHSPRTIWSFASSWPAARANSFAKGGSARRKCPINGL